MTRKPWEAQQEGWKVAKRMRLSSEGAWGSERHQGKRSDSYAWGTAAHTYNPSTWRDRQEDEEFKASLNYIRPLKKLWCQCWENPMLETPEEENEEHSATLVWPPILRSSWTQPNLQHKGFWALIHIQLELGPRGKGQWG